MDKANDLLQENFGSILIDNLSATKISVATRERLINFSCFIFKPSRVKIKNRGGVIIIYDIDPAHLDMIRSAHKALRNDITDMDFDEELKIAAIEACVISFYLHYKGWVSIGCEIIKGNNMISIIVSISQISSPNEMKEEIQKTLLSIIYDLTRPSRHINTNRKVPKRSPYENIIRAKNELFFDQFLQDSNLLDNIMQTMKGLGLLTEAYTPKTDMLTFKVEATRYLKQCCDLYRANPIEEERDEAEVIKTFIKFLGNGSNAKTCSHCNETYYPRRKSKQYPICNRPKCLRAYQRKRQKETSLIQRYLQ